MITLYKHFDNKTQQAAKKYQSAWHALYILDPNSSWSMQLKELRREHISGPGQEPNDISNSCYKPSWIWLMPRVNGLAGNEMTIAEAEFNETMHIEWLKARACMHR